MVEPVVREKIIFSEGIEDLASIVLAKKKVFLCRIHGWSMFPAIPNSSLIRLEAVQAQQIAIGDVVLAKTPQVSVVVHRVKKKMDSAPAAGFLLKGDCSRTKADFVMAYDIIARISAICLNDTWLSLDSGWGRWRDRMYSAIAPLAGLLLPIAASLLLLLQKSKFYRLLLNRCAPKHLLFEWKHPAHESYRLCVRSHKEVIGSLDVSYFSLPESRDRRWWISAMWVSLRFRGRGIGRKALFTALDFMKKQGADSVRLRVDSGNTAAIALYEQTGFRKLCGEGQNSIILQRRIP